MRSDYKSARAGGIGAPLHQAEVAQEPQERVAPRNPVLKKHALHHQPELQVPDAGVHLADLADGVYDTAGALDAGRLMPAALVIRLLGMAKQLAAILYRVACIAAQAPYCLAPDFFLMRMPCSSAMSMSVLSAKTLSWLYFSCFSSFSICLRCASISAVWSTDSCTAFFDMVSSICTVSQGKDAHFSWISKGLRQEFIQEARVFTLGRLYFKAISFLDLPLCMYSMQILRFNARLNFCLLITLKIC